MRLVDYHMFFCKTPLQDFKSFYASAYNNILAALSLPLQLLLSDLPYAVQRKVYRNPMRVCVPSMVTHINDTGESDFDGWWASPCAWGTDV